jgi:H+-transporting ATPase
MSEQPPNHLGHDVPSGELDEKKALEHDASKEQPPPAAKPVEDDDDEEEDMDALIEELESQDAAADLEEEEEAQPGGAKPVPEDLLQTDTRIGLTSDEVVKRRKRFGLNQMREEKENLILKFLGFFIGPIQFVMEVSSFWLLVRLRVSHSSTCDAKTRSAL